MHALVNAFLRCASFLLPSSWLCVSVCWRVGNECAETNPRAPFTRTKPLTYEEVAAPPEAQRGSRPPLSPGPGCPAPSPAPSPAPPHGPASGGTWIGAFWRAVERVFGALWVLLRHHWCPKSRRAASRSPCPACRCELSQISRVQGGAAAAAEAGEASAGNMSDSAGVPSPDPAAAPEQGSDEVVAVEQHTQEMGKVTITVAIQAAEDEDPEDASANNLDFLGGGSCSEDELRGHDKSSGAGTSGGELEDESWKPPDPELIQKLVAQIEYYLSDENLEHDAFLLKHVRRNKLGFVSVKLLTSFKKVKHLTRDWRTTAFALRHSQILELNEEGRKVRRKSTVPVFASESLPSRMLLLSDLQKWPELAALTKDPGGGEGGPPQQEQLMKLLLKAFGTYGAISSVRVLKPGKDLPADLKRLSGRYAQLGTEECAIVEFEEVEAAVTANEAVGGEQGGISVLGLKVVLIGTKPPKKKVPKERPREEGGMRKSRSLNSRVRELQYCGEDSACSSSDTESTPTSPRLARKSQSCNKLSPTAAGAAFPNNHLSPGMSPRNSPWSSPRASPGPQRKSPHPHISPLASEGRLSPEPGRRWADYSSDSSLTPCGSPWVQRRKQVASQESSPVGSPMLGRKIQNADGLPLGVMRLPRGPDGTRGFHCAAAAGERGKTAATQT
ncbi:la-related protein 6a [Takifugu rubripes]|uniref:La ribonucleoprotein 6, translational regulator a n=1 Tax=Takifugu rubripes TaxID=31033 RepID=A0A674PFU9_TAKRU|nr:la-related protein 6 [Takifugu rubripes]|eukprot:XP_003976332.1 PREDICTED: la-related protein 6 [Takifugu rubripes]